MVTENTVHYAQIYLYVAVRNTHLSIKIRDNIQTVKYNQAL